MFALNFSIKPSLSHFLVKKPQELSVLSMYSNFLKHKHKSPFYLMLSSDERLFIAAIDSRAAK